MSEESSGRPPRPEPHPAPGVEQLGSRWGPFYGFRADSGVSEALRLYGEYGALEVMLYARLLSTGDVVVDAGCNIGVIARALAAECPGVRVIGFEPQPDCYRLAVANTFHHADVTVYPLALSDRDGTVAVAEYGAESGAEFGAEFGAGGRRNFGMTGVGVAAPAADAGDRGRTVPVATVRLDGFLAGRAPRPRLVKIDVEGMEAAVVRGLAGLVHDRLVISAEADRPDRVPGLLRELRALGCRCHAALFRAIRPDNPRFDANARHCRNVHPHILAFAGPEPDWIPAVSGMAPVETAEEFAAVIDRHFAGPAAG